MTTHSDRDRSERPWWPPAATRQADLDEPVPFVLSDEPQGERVRFPLDDGDTGEAMLRVTSIYDHEAGEIVPMVPLVRAPEGTLLRCSMCPATLADTGGGVLWHMEDGTHTYEPSSAPARNPLHGMPATGDAERTIPAEAERGSRHPEDCERCYWRGRAETAEARVARVESVCQNTDGEWLDGDAEIPVGEVMRMLFPEGGGDRG